jgi:pimeloyl-ACP methyl ester carboxylesterase
MMWSRPGYAGSDRVEGRSVAQVAADAHTVLEALGMHDFVTLGWSGGGPHALACAALLSDRCRAAATLAGAAPYDVDGLDFLAGMGKENVEEFTLAVSDPQGLRRFLDADAETSAHVTADEIVASFGSLASDVDKAALTGEFAETVAELVRRAVSTGTDGWFDDDLAFVKPWGFDVRDIDVPVTVWQGEQDLMVPFAHGQWLAANIPTARPHLLPDEGHLSLAAQLDRIVADLATAAPPRR